MNEKEFLDELPGGSKTQAARRKTQDANRDEREHEIRIIAMTRSSSVLDIARFGLNAYRDRDTAYH